MIRSVSASSTLPIAAASRASSRRRAPLPRPVRPREARTCSTRKSWAWPELGQRQRPSRDLPSQPPTPSRRRSPSRVPTASGSSSAVRGTEGSSSAETVGGSRRPPFPSPRDERPAAPSHLPAEAPSHGAVGRVWVTRARHRPTCLGGRGTSAGCGDGLRPESVGCPTGRCGDRVGDHAVVPCGADQPRSGVRRRSCRPGVHRRSAWTALGIRTPASTGCPPRPADL